MKELFSAFMSFELWEQAVISTFLALCLYAGVDIIIPNLKEIFQKKKPKK